MANIDRIDSLANVKALKEEFKFIIDNLSQVRLQINQLGQIEAIAKAATSMKELKEAVDGLNAATENIPNVENKLSEAQSGLQTPLEEPVKPQEEQKTPKKPKEDKPSSNNEEQSKKNIDAYQAEIKNIKSLITTEKQQDATFKELIDVSVQNEQAIKRLSEIKKQLTKDFKDGNISQEQFKKSLGEIKEASVGLVTSQKEVTKTLNAIEKEAQAAEGSLDQMRARLVLLQQAYGKLSDEEKETKLGVALAKDAEDLANKINDQQKRVGDFTKNVGRYAESLGGLFDKVADEITKLQTKQQNLVNLQKTNPIGFKVAGGETELNKTNAALKELGNLQASVSKEGQSFVSVQKNIEKGFQNMTAAGNQSEDFLIGFKLNAAKAKDEAADLKDELKALSSDTRGLDLAAGAITSITDTLQVAAGTAALFGANSKDTERILVKLTAVQSVANGVRSLAEQITKRGTAANIAYNFVIEQGTILFGKGSTAAARFGAAIKFIGIGILITGITYLITKLDLFGESTKDAAEEAEKLNQALVDIYNTQKDLVDLLAKNPEIGTNILLLKKQLALQQASGEGARALFNTRKKIAEEEQKLADAQLDDLINKAQVEDVNFDKQIKGLDAVQNAQEFYYKETREGEVTLNKLRNQRIKILTTGSEKEIEQFDLEIKKQENYVSETKSHFDDYTSIINNAADKEIALQELITAETFRRQQERRKAILEITKFQTSITEREKKAIVDADNLFDPKTRIAASRQVAEAQINLINKVQENELLQKGLIKEQIDLINSKAADDREQIEISLQDKIFAIQLNAKVKYIQMLSDVKSEADRISQELEDKETARITKRVEFVEQNFQQRLGILTIQNDQEIAKTNELFLQKKISREELDKQLLLIDKKYLLAGLEEQVKHDESLLISTIQDQEKRIQAEDDYGKLLLETQGKNTYERLELELDYYEKLIQASGLTGQALIDAEMKIAAIRKQIKQQQVQDNDEETQKIIDGINKVKQTYDDVAGLISGILNAQAIEQKNRIQAQIDGIEKAKAAELAAVEVSVDSEQNKAARIAAIEARSQSQKEILAQRQRAIDRRKAIFDKANSISQIILGTAVAVASAKSLFEAIARAALGAAQLAIAVSTPIPQFKDGTKGKPFKGGYAIVGDGGKHEGIKLPDGRLLKSRKTPTLMKLPKGTEIEPDFDKMFINASLTNTPEYISETRYVDSGLTDRAIERMEKNVVNAIKSQAKLNMDVTEAGIASMWVNGSNNTKYIEQQTNWNK